MWTGTKHNVAKIPGCVPAVTLGGAHVVKSDAVQVLGDLLPSDLSLDMQHVRGSFTKFRYMNPSTVIIIIINVKKLQFIHKLTASNTSKTVKITKQVTLPISTSPKCHYASE